MNVFSEFEAIVRDLDREQINYALIGGVALAFYSAPRNTKDIDLLIPSAEVARLTDILTAHGYEQFAPPWTFRDSGLTLHRFLKFQGEEEMMIDALASDEEQYAMIVERAEPVAEERYGIVRLAQREDLIWLKQKRNSKQDQADIERLSDGDEETE